MAANAAAARAPSYPIFPSITTRDSEQSLTVARNIKVATYGLMARNCNPTGIRLAAVPTVVCMYLTEVVACLAATVEAVVKGLINVGGAIAYGITGWEVAKDCKCFLGLRQLFVNSFMTFYGTLPITVVCGVLVMIVDLINVIKTPQEPQRLKIAFDEYLDVVRSCGEC